VLDRALHLLLGLEEGFLDHRLFSPPCCLRWCGMWGRVDANVSRR
jgi:hypothetical protein